MAGGFASAGAAGTASGNMIGAIQTALTQADMKDKLMTSGESAAAIYWDGWMNFFSTVSLPTPQPPGGTATPPGGKAAGGPVSSGVPYIVGERGPEFFVPRSAGTIRAMLDSAGFRRSWGVTTPLPINVRMIVAQA